MESSHEYDLPLSANYNEVQVKHFVLDLSCEMTAKIFHGSITYFIKVLPPKIDYHKTDIDAQNIQTNAIRQIKLDCYDMTVTKCLRWRVNGDELGQSSMSTASENDRIDNALQVSQSLLDEYWQTFISLEDRTKKEELEFKLEKHCLKISVPCFTSLESLVVTVYFRTHPEGRSLMWTNDQDGRPCVFTIGDAFNNRSLFPAQDMPQAMPTWHCNVKLTDLELKVLMTGEAEPVVHLREQEVVFHYYNSYRMPASTFALAVGSWSCHVLDQPSVTMDNSRTTNQADGLSPRCRIHCPNVIKSDTVNQLTKYLPACFASIASILEPYPFQRLDILITADCFDSLGLACPNLLILSQSLLSSDLSLFHRVAHELCHTWFGILLGPKNWTEEWLTEGICCYLEDIVHARAMKWTEQEIKERNELKSYLKYKILKSEIDYTQSSLQMLRPDGDTDANIEEGQHFVTNGINSERSHIHYMKGFFLLKLLERTSGQDSFLSALKQFVKDYIGKLFSSQEILEYFFEHCSSLRESSLTVPSLCQDWLDSPGIPKALESFPYPINSNRLYQQVLREFDALKSRASCRKRKRKGEKCHLKSDPSNNPDTEQELLPDQIILLLGLITESPEVRIPPVVMDGMRHRYSIFQANAEVQHAWCELVVQQRCARWYGDVQAFLHQHRAMGLYLYGEMMISECGELQTMAHTCYQHHRTSMPRAALKELREILAIDEDEKNEAEDEKSGDNSVYYGCVDKLK